MIYKRTGNRRAVGLLLGHTELARTVRYLGGEVEEALALSKPTDLRGLLCLSLAPHVQRFDDI